MLSFTHLGVVTALLVVYPFEDFVSQQSNRDVLAATVFPNSPHPLVIYDRGKRAVHLSPGIPEFLQVFSVVIKVVKRYFLRKCKTLLIIKKKKNNKKCCNNIKLFSVCLVLKMNLVCRAKHV